MPEERRLAFRLALALGWHNPDAMLETMPWRVWNEWQTYALYEPFGETRADLRGASTMALMANLWGRGQGDPAFTVDQFMPKFGPVGAGQKPADTERKAKTPDELFEILKLHHAAMTGEIVDGPDPDAS